MLSLLASGLCQYKMSKVNPADELCTLVVDSGYSFTHIIPYHKNKKIKDGIKRFAAK